MTCHVSLYRKLGPIFCVLDVHSFRMPKSNEEVTETGYI